MDFGVHLPLVDFGDGSIRGGQLRTYVTSAAELGYATLAANDHLRWQRPWLDGPTTLTSVVEHTGAMALATSVALPSVRHPVVLAKWLTTLGVLTGNRVIAGLGPGSSKADYAAVGLPFEDRWARFDEAFRAVRGLVRGEDVVGGTFYDLRDVHLDPLPGRAPEVWFGSWGSDSRLRAMAAVADGWLASGYNTTPTTFAEARARFDHHLQACGRDPSTVPDLIATTWLYVTSDPGVAEGLLVDVLAPVLRRDPAQLAAILPIGPPEHCVELLTAYRDAGAHQILLWPIKDPIDQLATFVERVRPHVAG